MKDSITISVIATCFKDAFETTGEKSVAEEIISTTSSSSKNDFASFINSRTSTTPNDDAYSELESLFQNRK